MRKIANFLILFGILLVLVCGGILYKRNDPQRLSFTVEKIDFSERAHEEKKPIAISIKSIGTRLPLIPARVNKSAWETTDKGVSYLSDSPPPGEVGNSILYGHNWGSILGNLYKVRPGEKIEIYFSDGTVREFEVQIVQEVSADNGSVLAPTSDRRITLYTCSGLLDQKRLVVTASLIESSAVLSHSSMH